MHNDDVHGGGQIPNDARTFVVDVLVGIVGCDDGRGGLWVDHDEFLALVAAVSERDAWYEARIAELERRLEYREAEPGVSG